MAIKFVDQGPEEKPAERLPSAEREPDAEALERPIEPELPHAKPEPKPKGRKKPLK